MTKPVKKELRSVYERVVVEVRRTCRTGIGVFCDSRAFGQPGGRDNLRGGGWIVTANDGKKHDFFSTDNWDQGLITGEFGSGLGKNKTTQTITFGQDWSGNLSFTHSNEAFLTLCGDGSRDATWFVPGDVTFAAGAWKGWVKFGTQNAGSKFYVDLGGKSPTFTMKGTSGYYFYNTISNGAFRIGGESTSFVSFYNDDATVDGDIYFYGTNKM